MVDQPFDPEEDLEQIRAIARDVGNEPIELLAPPAGLWEGIQQAIADPAPASADVSTPAVADASAGGSIPDPTTGSSEVTPIRPVSATRPTTVPWVLAAAAAAVVVVVVGGIAMLAMSDRPEEVVAPTVVAETELEPLAEVNAGSASLLDEDGSLRIEVSTDPIAVDDGSFAEVWMINPDVTELISLGPLRADGIYEVPAGVDPAAFPVIDVSVEPIDGDPTHSGNSVLRGILEL